MSCPAAPCRRSERKERVLKTTAPLGGMSWESSRIHSRIINEEVARRMGGLHSARGVMLSFNSKSRGVAACWSMRHATFT